MDRDGTKIGFDIALTRTIADAVSVPVIASGGVGTLDHLVEGIRDGHASAVLAASIFHFGEFSIGEAKRYMAKAGLADASRSARRLNGQQIMTEAFTLDALAATHRRPRQRDRSDQSYTQSLLDSGHRPRRQEIRRGSVRGGDRRCRTRSRGLETGSRRCALSSIGLASRRRRSVAGCYRRTCPGAPGNLAIRKRRPVQNKGSAHLGGGLE